MTASSTKPLLNVLAREKTPLPPWWLMRQAGRYLPEYRAVRNRIGSFLELCLSPVLAAELTMQPVRRYGMDAAILFSDILILPYALGQALEYRDGTGPVLEALAGPGDLGRLNAVDVLSRLAPVLETVERVRGMLGPRTALIGFAGAPWTVATYMVEGGTSRDFHRVKSWAYGDPLGFARLMEMLTEATGELLAAQVAAGAEAVQLFDSWAGVLPETYFVRWVIRPTARIVAFLKDRYPRCPVIGFPRAAGVLYERYVTETGVDAVGLDPTVPLGFAVARLGGRAVLQGNLDPVLLLVGGSSLEAAVVEMRHSFAATPWIFNLGHGVLPETPVENVATLARLLAAPEPG